MKRAILTIILLTMATVGAAAIVELRLDTHF